MTIYMLSNRLGGAERRRWKIVRERRLRVRGEMERVYRLGLRHLGGLRMVSRVSSGVIEESRGSVGLLDIVSIHDQLPYVAYLCIVLRLFEQSLLIAKH
jgi:hypothetical protein